MTATRFDLGQPGHFVGAHRCRFHLHTHLRGFCVSTVGEWFPEGAAEIRPLAAEPGSFYETMIFELDRSGFPGTKLIDGGYASERSEANGLHHDGLLLVEAAGLPGDPGGLLCDRECGTVEMGRAWCALQLNHDGPCAPGRGATAMEDEP